MSDEYDKWVEADAKIPDAQLTLDLVLSERERALKQVAQEVADSYTEYSQAVEHQHVVMAAWDRRVAEAARAHTVVVRDANTACSAMLKAQLGAKP
jgi:hypothetical protein